jgi:hypothetical protein
MVQVLLLIVVLFIICQSFKIIPDLYEVYACTVGKNITEQKPNFLVMSVYNKLSRAKFGRVFLISKTRKSVILNLPTHTVSSPVGISLYE